MEPIQVQRWVLSAKQGSNGDHFVIEPQIYHCQGGHPTTRPLIRFWRGGTAINVLQFPDKYLMSFSIYTVHLRAQQIAALWFTLVIHTPIHPLTSHTFGIFISVYEPLIPVNCHQKFRVSVGLKEILAGQRSVKRLIQKRAQVKGAHRSSTPWHSTDLNVTTYVYSQLLG